MSNGASSRDTANDAVLESLMRRYQESDAAAATQLAEQLSGKLYRFFVAQVRDRELAEDLLQDCWLRIHKARHTYRPAEPLLPWVYAIARRVQVDQYRKRRRISKYELQKEHIGDIAAAAIPESTQSCTGDVSDLLSTLPPRQRETVLMLKVGGLSLEEVSRATGASVGAVKQRAHRAYVSLRRLFGEDR